MPTAMPTPALTVVRRSRRGRRRALTVGVATVLAVVVVGASGASYAAVKALDGGGTQPEDVLPSTVVAVAKIDMDPAFGQKRAIYQLSRKFPRSGTKGTASVKDDLLRSLFEGSDFTYDRDIKPWVGQRAAIGAVPDAKSEYGFTSVAAVQYTDVAKTRAALRRIVAVQAKLPGGNHLFFTLKNGYVLIAASQAKAKAYAASPQPLSAVLGYRDAMSALEGDQIATAWLNIKATYLATPKADRKENPLFASLTSVPTGYLVAGVHAASSYIEVQGKAVGTNEEMNRNLYGGVGLSPGANLLASYPADTWAAVDAVGLGDAMVRYYHSSGLDEDPGVATRAKKIGLQLPADIKTLLGAETAIGVIGEGVDTEVVGHVLSSKPVASVGVAAKLVASLAGSRQQVSGLIRAQSDGYYVGTSKAAVTRAAAGTEKLGDTVSFKRALPEAQGAGLAIYVNIQAELRAFGSDPQELRDNRYVDAFGFTANPTTGTFRLRLTVK